jgi:hypothetical protein
MLTYNPFGLAPFSHLGGGTVRPDIYPGTIASGYANNIFQNSPIQIDAATPSGNLILAAAQGAAGASTAAQRILGSFQGVEYTLTATGRRTVGNFWAASTVATAIVAWHTRDPNIAYRIQANGSVAATAVGAQASITTNGSANGNTTTGFSTVGFDVTTANSLKQDGSLNQLRIIGFDPDINNTPGDAFTSLIVQISAHQDVAQVASY